MAQNFNIKKELSNNLDVHMSHIHQCCYKFLKDPEEISLMKSEVLEKIWTKQHLFSGTHSEFKAWVFTITRNTFISKYNKNKGKHTDDISEMYNPPSIDFDVQGDIDNKKQLKDIIYTIDTNFKKLQADVFKANVIDGKKYEECAEEFDLPMGTVKNIIHVIRKYVSDPLNIISEKRLPVKVNKIIIPKTRIINLLIKIRNQYNRMLHV